MIASGISAIMSRNGRSAAVPAATLGDAVGTPSPVSKRPVANSGFPFGSSSLIGCLLQTGFLLCPLSSVNGQRHIDPCPELLRRYAPARLESGWNENCRCMRHGPTQPREGTAMKQTLEKNE